jgi:hypothetical protein
MEAARNTVLRGCSCSSSRDRSPAERRRQRPGASIMNKGFLVLFFKKEQRFFLQKEAKTLIPHEAQQLFALTVGGRSMTGFWSKKPEGISLKPHTTQGCTG